ncbi:hypothetical protein [Agrobacterium sp. YIC 4121]|uniref:hypothetical protein n=1 Tax=Agrobacterium sp. YIC 4121 TaxID=1923829 RepID=UPI00098FE9DD|nr:hypothetical protein [Agrobacterium sp. YIC 4121]OOO25648.1 hypothetical protein BTE54_23875 [Agrobacterium sp. YIC 4121]
MTNPQSPWYTESITPPIDYVPVTPTPRKYVLRGLKRGAFSALTAVVAIGLIMLFPLAIVAIAVLGAFWWLFCRLFAR